MGTSFIVDSLMKTRNFRHFFNQLGFLKESKEEAMMKLVKIVGKQYGECNMVERPLKKWQTDNVHENAFVFIEADICTPHPYHNKPFYVKSTINEYPLRRTFIDDVSSINLMYLSTLRTLS